MRGRADRNRYHCSFFLGKLNTLYLLAYSCLGQATWQLPGNPRALSPCGTPSSGHSLSNVSGGGNTSSTFPLRPKLSSILCPGKEAKGKNCHCHCKSTFFLFLWSSPGEGSCHLSPGSLQEQASSGPHSSHHTQSAPAFSPGMPCPPERRKGTQVTAQVEKGGGLGTSSWAGWQGPTVGCQRGRWGGSGLAREDAPNQMGLHGVSPPLLDPWLPLGSRWLDLGRASRRPRGGAGVAEGVLTGSGQ